MLSYLNSNFAQTLGYLNPALNNLGPVSRKAWKLFGPEGKILKSKLVE